MPLMFDIFAYARCVTAAPAGIDGKCAETFRVGQYAFADEPRFLKQFPTSCFMCRFIGIQRTGDGLPEFEGCVTLQQKNVAFV